MSTDSEAAYIAALTQLHIGLERKGPGDADFSRNILDTLPVPSNPRIADLGCGSGVGAVLLAQYYQSRVQAVDASSAFIDELKNQIKQLGLESLIDPIHGDMAELNWPAESIDLLWSEGAAYNLGFETALKTWRPLLAPNGIAVVSELSWFVDDVVSSVPKDAIAFWQAAYPTMGTETENRARARRAGYQVLSTQRLPSQAWWDHYYTPLRQRMQQVEATPVMQSVVRETEEEMTLFEQFSDDYGYTFYVLQAV